MSELNKKEASNVLENEFPLIPMSEIDDTARKMAVAWMECEDKNWIGQNHKLASDIMNYHRIKSAEKEQRIQQLENDLSKIVEMKLEPTETDYKYAFNRCWHIASQALQNKQ